MSFEESSLATLSTPAFVVDLDVVERNCAKMLSLAEDKLRIGLRAQTKTHKTIEGALLQTAGKRRGLVTSTLTETELYAEAGFDDILYGYPLVEAHMDRNYRLTDRLKEYHVMITGQAALDVLLKREPPKNKKWSVFLKIDCGTKRAGMNWAHAVQQVEIGKRLQQHSDKIIFQGLYVHCGNTYAGKNVQEVKQIRADTLSKLSDVTKTFRSNGVTVNNVGIGSTPSCSHEDDDGDGMKDLTEIHPGNYVFYDVMQQQLGSCAQEDIAGRVMTRVLDHYPHRNQMLVDCGFTALTKQGFEAMGQTHAIIYNHPGLKLVSMTQELGNIGPADDGKTIDFDKYPVGSILFLLPYHSCATAAMYPVYYVHRNGIVKETWKPCRGWE